MAGCTPRSSCVSIGTRCTPKPWSRGISFSATSGSLTRRRIWSAMNSENSALASSSMKISRKLREPDAEARLAVQLLPHRQPLLARHLEEGAAVGLVVEAARRAGAGGEDLVVARLMSAISLVGDRPVVQRRAPVRPALEHGELAHLVGDLADDLDAGRAGADHGDPLAGQLDRLVRPVVGVERAALEAVHALSGGAGWGSTAGPSP